jgi:hypothetical protein
LDTRERFGNVDLSQPGVHRERRLNACQLTDEGGERMEVGAVAGFEPINDRKNSASSEIEGRENRDSIDPLGCFERWGVHGEIDLDCVAVTVNDEPTERRVPTAARTSQPCCRNATANASASASTVPGSGPGRAPMKASRSRVPLITTCRIIRAAPPASA